MDAKGNTFLYRQLVPSALAVPLWAAVYRHKLTDGGGRSLRGFSVHPCSPSTTKKEKRKVISIFRKKTFHLLPVLGMETSSAMDRLPPCGHRGMWASAGNHRGRNAPGSKSIQLPPPTQQQAKCCNEINLGGARCV